MKLPIAGLLLSRASTPFTYWNDRDQTFGATPPRVFDNQSIEILQHAIAKPNATRQISFRPFEVFTGNAPLLGPDEWTWRVNISEFSLLHLAQNTTSENLGRNIINPHYIATSYSLSWPRGGNISAGGLRGSDSPFCVTSLDVEFFPNVTNLWTEAESNSTDCEPVLGESCLDALRVEDKTLTAKGCAGRKPSWRTIPECNATFGYGAVIYGARTSNLNPNVTGNSTSTTGDPVTSGSEMMGFGSGLVDSGDATQTYLNASNRVQILIFNTWVGEERFNVRLARPNIHCMRVNSTRVASSAAFDEGSLSWEVLLVSATVTVLMSLV
ncbi:hypothetical protein BDP55DRAFT_770744 [Colletotrichum godetiae]|uniref:Uncharacterized protein n=1 Tax=Colletotrichum godetiae TaxID=1209918 RepID=A0AAJ0EUY4_9PEZI|nr:uncharacterized protein BDP55DRAFT_770744 [Colletotrichum godetiae]KAK1672684.1 hypothetical protein BDP55DRAFT_770744 [Colletotrichum godetiae]